MLKKLAIIMIALSISIKASAQPEMISVDLQDVNVSDAIRIVANYLQLNVVVSPKVSGAVTLHLKNSLPEEILDILLVSQGLMKWQTKNILYIAPADELKKQKTLQEEISYLVTKTWQLKYAKVEDVLKVFHSENAGLLTKRGHVRVDSRTNTLSVQDTLDSLDVVRKFISIIDVPVKQVLIDARIVSIDSDCEQELGVDFASSANSPAYHFALAKVGSSLDIKLAAMEDAGHARLISSPSLFTANQQSASIEAGEEIPYQEVSESGGTAVVFKKAVLGLKVTPQILPGDKVLLYMQINQDRPSNKMVQGVPTISTRQILTNIVVKNGQTIVLGGIYESDQEIGEQAIPYVSRAPLVGELFKLKHTRTSKRKLLIFVTPKVMITNESRQK